MHLSIRIRICISLGVKWLLDDARPNQNTQTENQLALTRWSRWPRRTLDDARGELVALDGCGEAAIAPIALVALRSARV